MEDALLKPNRESAGRLQQKRIPYECRELPGEHEWHFRDARLPPMLRVLVGRLAVAVGERAFRAMHPNPYYPILDEGTPPKARC